VELGDVGACIVVFLFIFLFITRRGGGEVLRFFKWKPATNSFGFVLRIENRGRSS
jgi:hypothetical protein